MSKILLTGGSGFFGTILKGHLREQGHAVMNLDRFPDPVDVRQGQMAQVDLRDFGAVERVFQEHGPFHAVCHVAAELAHEARQPQALWQSNVEGTRHLAELSQKYRVEKFIFTSTNCLWGKPLNRPVREEDLPEPIEIYGRSKTAAEEILKKFSPFFHVVIFRSPTIIAPGRVGLLGILFDFIAEGRRLPVVGRGNKPYQFIYADDYARAMLLALAYPHSETFHIGSDHPVSLESAYRYVIEKAGSRSRIYHLPKFPTLQLMRLCHALGLSPLGPYHYSMIAEEFVFATNRIKEKLNWQPTKTNGEILFAAFAYYQQNKAHLQATASDLPAHRRSAKVGIINLLRLIS